MKHRHILAQWEGVEQWRWEERKEAGPRSISVLVYMLLWAALSGKKTQNQNKHLRPL